MSMSNEEMDELHKRLLVAHERQADALERIDDTLQTLAKIDAEQAMQFEEFRREMRICLEGIEMNLRKRD